MLHYNRIGIANVCVKNCDLNADLKIAKPLNSIENGKLKRKKKISEKLLLCTNA